MFDSQIWVAFYLLILSCLSLCYAIKLGKGFRVVRWLNFGIALAGLTLDLFGYPKPTEHGFSPLVLAALMAVAMGGQTYKLGRIIAAVPEPSAN